jgi:hypothetical protein
MSPERLIYERSKRSFNVLAGAIFLSLSLAFGSIYLRDSLKQGVVEGQNLLAAQRTSLETKKQDLGNIQTHIAQFRVLKQQGLVGHADREGWVEQLVASREQLGVGSSIVYNLKPAQALVDSTIPDPAGAVPAAAPSAIAPDVPATHDLEFELVGVHEAELVTFLNHYRAKVTGQFRVQACRLGRATPNGLVANCTLRFIHLPEPAKQK